MAHGYPDWEGNKSGLYLMPEWAAFEATDKNFGGVGVLDRAFGEQHVAAYLVPPGKTFYITHFSGVNYASAAADADKNQQCSGSLSGGWTFSVKIGGNGGFSLVFPKPIVAVAGTNISAACANRANHNTKAGVTFSGYEI